MSTRTPRSVKNPRHFQHPSRRLSYRSTGSRRNQSTRPKRTQIRIFIGTPWRTDLQTCPLPALFSWPRSPRLGCGESGFRRQESEDRQGFGISDFTNSASDRIHHFAIGNRLGVHDRTNPAAARGGGHPREKAMRASVAPVWQTLSLH